MTDNPQTTPHLAIAALPEWLRFHGKHNSCPDDHADCEWRSMLDAAANEIERLRAELEGERHNRFYDQRDAYWEGREGAE